MAQPLNPNAPPPAQNYQVAYSSLGGGLGGNLGTAVNDSSSGVTQGSITQTPRFGAGGLLGGARPPVAGAIPGANSNVPDVNPQNPAYVPTYGGGMAPGAGAGGGAAPTFGATDPAAIPGGDYNRDPLTSFGGKTAIAPTGAYDIGPYYGYAFDAGNRVVQSGYDAASQLANAGTQAAALGVGGGQDVAAVAQGYAGDLARQGQAAQVATQQYETQLKGYGAQSAAGATAAQQIGTAGQLAAQQAGTAMGAQGGQFIQQGKGATDQDIAGVDLTASRAALGQSQTYANQLAGIGAQPGPSAAQAQLQSALNQSNAQNLAMARSGRGWGGSASAQSQALAANAAAGQQAANASAVLRAQEEQQRMQMLSSNVGQAAQLQQAGAQTALGQQQARAAVNLQEQQQLAQQQQALYGLGLQAQQQGAELGLQGANVALQGNQAYQAGIGQAGQLAAQGAQTDLAGRQAYLQALQQSGALATQGAQAGTELGLQGIGMGAGLYGQGQQMAQAGELQAMQFAAQQQQALAAQANAALQQYGVQKGVAIQQQANTNQLIGAGVQAAGSLGAAALMFSDRRMKDEIKPANVDLRPMSNYEIAGSAAGGAPVATTGGVNTGATQLGADAAKDEKQKQGIAMIGDAVSGFGANMGRSQGINPVLAQSLQNVGAPVMSDRRSKGDIQELDAAGSDAVRAIQGAPGMAAQSVFDQTPAYSYQYKQPEKYGEGEFIGLMAQDLAKSPAGSTAVVPQADGKLAVDTQRLGMLTAAAQSQTQERQDELEDKLARLQRRVLAQQSYADGTY